MMSKRFLFHALIAAVFMIVTVPSRAVAESMVLGVIYPEVEEPYLGIFLQIVEGVKEKARGEVVLYRARGEVDTSSLNVWLRERSVKRAILLGRQGVKLARFIEPGIRVVVGGAILAPGVDGATPAGISLTPDPEQLFAMLKQLAPSTKRVNVIFNPAQNHWLIEMARESAKRYGLELVAREARDLRAAALEYQDILNKAEGKREALWLPQDSSTVDDELILPMILKEAWRRDLLVFSSNFAHAKKGVLFALYPDNRGWGRELADLAYGAGPLGIMPLKALRSVINLRTASHLGVEANPSKFDTVFPEP